MIETYSFGRMRVAGEEHRDDLIVIGPRSEEEAERVEGEWWRKEGHRLEPADLAAVAKALPETLVIGPGAYGRMVVPEATVAWLEGLGIRPVVCATTAEAVDLYNAIAGRRESVAGAFHLTC